MKNNLRVLFVILGITIISVGGYYFWQVNKKIDIEKPISMSDAYKICNRTSCPTNKVTIDAFIISTESGDPELVSIENGKATNGIILELNSLTALNKSNILNRDGYLLRNGILKVEIKGVMKFVPSYLKELKDRISLSFNLADIQVISKSGCLTNGYPFAGGASNCFVPLNSNIKTDLRQDVSKLDIELIRKNVFLCNEEIKPEIDNFNKEYKGGGNSGIAVPVRIFYSCLEKKIEVTDDIRKYIEDNSESITPPFLN